MSSLADDNAPSPSESMAGQQETDLLVRTADATKGATMQDVEFRAGTNIAIKIPVDRFEATVAFYRDTLGFDPTEEDVGETPTLSRSFSMTFGAIKLWLDCVESSDRTEAWLELQTDDLAGARERLAQVGVQPCDEIEPFPGLGTPHTGSATQPGWCTSCVNHHDRTGAVCRGRYGGHATPASAAAESTNASTWPGVST